MTCFQVSTLVENNERIYDTRHGGFVQFKDRQGMNCFEYLFSS